MFIQEVIVDGFKSYAHRTVIEGFDPHFNAITGLNGSGKSNILDAICFVLGITNLSQVRAGNLSELVYKQGQAGVNKATVTIVFNNDDEASSPVGYEQCSEVTVTRQVLLGGKSKYLINGRNAPAGQVQNLFHSVQLNVNNPHFLIMQGRITKVLNMKPNEILGMIEEAAGTRMYETKRLAALKTIDKKQLKLDELNSILSEEITPTLEKLRGEKENYLKYSKNNADMERLERLVLAYQFVKAKKALQANSEGSSEMEEKIKLLEAQAAEMNERIAEKESDINARSEKLKGEFEDTHGEIKKNEKKLSNDLVRVTSVWKNKKDNVSKAEGDVEAARSLVSETTDAVLAKEAEIEEESKRIEGIVAAAKEAETRVVEVMETYQNMSAGISSEKGDEGRTLPEQISQAHNDSKSAEAKVEQARMKISHLTKQLKAVEKDIKKEGKSAEKLASKCKAASKKVQDLKKQIEKLEFSEADYDCMEKEKVDLETSVSELSERVDTLTAQLQGRLAFKYSDPVRGFDREKVKGLVAKLIEVKDSKNSTALEVAAGGKLFQVVVDEAVTGKALLDRGKLARRVTIIPLDKIKSRQVSGAAVKNARSIAEATNSTANPAIELVGFDEEVRSAIEYVFGSTIVVDGMKAANQICDATKTRTVTLDGDVYEPSGTISGGSKNQLGTTLSKLAELTECKRQLEEQTRKLKGIEEALSNLKAASTKHDKLSAKLELAEAEHEAAEKHMSQTSFGVLVEKKDTMSKELEASELEIVSMEKEQSEKWDLYEQLKEQESELTAKREQRLADIEKDVKDAKADAAKKSQMSREAESRSQTLVLELESLKAELVAAKDALSITIRALEEAAEAESQTQMDVGQTQAVYEEVREKLDHFEQQMASCSAEVVDLKRQRDDMVKEADRLTLEAKQLSININRAQKERAGAEKAVASLLNNHEWIESEQSSFGVAGGDYDFEAMSPVEAERHYKDLKGEQESLGKKINKKVMGMIEKAEGEYTELLRKRKVVENDKKKIQKVIEELDVKKKSELQRTWVKVNRDFGSIFSTLLPGASAKLEPPEGMNAWEGLEVKVAFGQVWKESLSELSGGQRSLLALSLILSLLLFKPAPMYILDEVDAALDLSHTQNIGNMLKSHFSQSQFIVVSLKEGMFNNANVIFRTKFVDGVSTVTRTIGTGSSRSRTLTGSNGTVSPVQNDKVSAVGSGTSRRKGKENSAR